MNGNEAVLNCEKYIGQLDGALPQKQLTKLYSACLTDLKVKSNKIKFYYILCFNVICQGTGDITWALNLLDIGKNWVYENQFTTSITTSTTTTKTKIVETNFCTQSTNFCRKKNGTITKLIQTS